MRLRYIFTTFALTFSSAILAQQASSVQALSGQAFGVGKGFGAAVVASIRKRPHTGSSSQQQIETFHGVRVTLIRTTNNELIPVQIEATSNEAVRTISKELSEIPRSGIIQNLGTPESESADSVTYLGPAEICNEYLSLKFRENIMVSAKWRLCVD